MLGEGAHTRNSVVYCIYTKHETRLGRCLCSLLTTIFTQRMMESRPRRDSSEPDVKQRMPHHGVRERIVNRCKSAGVVQTRALERPNVEHTHAWVERAAQSVQAQELSRERVQIKSLATTTAHPSGLANLLLQLRLLRLLLLALLLVVSCCFFRSRAGFTGCFGFMKASTFGRFERACDGHSTLVHFRFCGGRY